MDELTTAEAPPTVELPELLRDLAWLKQRALTICRNPSHVTGFDLVAIESTVGIIIKILNAVEMRSLEEQIRLQDRAIARDNARRQPWD